MKKTTLILFLTAMVLRSHAQTDSTVTRVYFAFGKAALSQQAAASLDQWIAENGRAARIKISGQTDQVGSDVFNDQLAQQRANEVYAYLVGKGLNAALPHEIIAYGKRKPIVANDASPGETNRLNRVVTITSYTAKTEPAASSSIQNTTAPEAKPVQPKPKSFEQQLNEGSSTIVLNNLSFAGGRHVLLPASIPVLENVLETLKKHPNIEIEIQGHICCTDPSETDGVDLDTGEKTLSLNRARAVFEYLVANGISAGRMTYKGFGARNRLVFPETSEADYSMNRRVEFKITKQ